MNQEMESKIRAQAAIYHCQDKRPLTDYQKKINIAAGDIAIQDPSMLTQKKGNLLEAAKDEVYACGYNFKKGHSRSKRFSSDSSSSSTPKQKNLNKDF